MVEYRGLCLVLKHATEYNVLNYTSKMKIYLCNFAPLVHTLKTPIWIL